ncbi:beta-lactamase family protein [Flavobacteriaceae bacterium]|jgi:CubicO group peptidase (beta-lactamase class C family)|nr:beta-lactamase family protein [bacterium]MDB4093010.1 beta-lactamase family protein [Flavobacteriaceae bacterium]MDB9793465.1 beta-lactamase family protein [Flavobacteriaceae bacterium]MDC1279469.1 beta-lactamase family protein [Flavobacteriaceae bacterium]MDC1336988.1 beta-lactamase family protein [Flavobacteriaceae bacterium]|tara:strand:- start:5970 stop:7127 length:1158 start_codon:yes stop_codon:yes gene_type:complete
MKYLKSKIGLIISLFLIFCGFNFSSEIIYLSELGVTVYKMKRTKADITDYKYFENIEISKSSSPQPWPIHKNYNLIQETKNLKKTHAKLGTIAYLIIKNDSIWHEKYYKNYNQNSYSNSFSMAKSIVSATMGKAIKDGYFKSIDDKVGFYIKGYSEGFAAKLTIGDLSSMSSGLDWDESYTNIFGVTAKSYITSELNELIKSRSIIEEPGKNFKYYSASTQLLAMSIEKATENKISNLVQDWFVEPLGFENNALWQIDGAKNKSIKAYCCFNSNARDFARFGKLYKDFGKWNGIQILDSSFVVKSIKPRFEKSPEYGYGFWLGKINENNFFAMRGILGQYVIILPEKNIIIVRLGQRNLEKNNDRPKDFDIYLKEALIMLESVKV